MQPLPVAVDLHVDVLGVPHDRSLDEALHVVVVEGLGAGARGAVLGSVGHALAWPMRDARSGERSPACESFYLYAFRVSFALFRG